MEEKGKGGSITSDTCRVYNDDAQYSEYREHILHMHRLASFEATI